MDPESGTAEHRAFRYLKTYKTTLLLAYQSFGVVYGDLSTSPLYVYKSTFSGKLSLLENDDEILGVLSLVFWTLTLIPLCKYIIIVLGADDNGEGGTFALYSLLCRHSKISLLQTPYPAHHQLSAYKSGTSLQETRASSLLKEFFEQHRNSRIALLLIVLLGTSMVIGDGVLTPTMSVLSATSGIKIKIPELHEYYTVSIACIVLVGLFALQHYGTHRVGFLFAPILIAWLLCISAVGTYNIIHWNPSVVRALSPYYIYNFFRKAGMNGWSSLGGIVLCVTGAEAMFADLGHFSQLSIRIAFTGVVYPCLVLAYMGEAAYLSKHRQHLQSSFFKSIPEPIFWPVFVIATLATVVASQAIISATFSIISQCTALKCFPRVRIIHTSNQIHGQIYIPEINWLLLCLCIAVVVGFKETDSIGNAYGLAVITVMFVTTWLMFLVIITVWKRSVLSASLFVAVFGSLELLYFSSSLTKVPNGGWFPLLLSLVVMTTMSIWHYGTSKKRKFEFQNKLSLDRLLALAPNLGIVRVAGIGLIYSDMTTGLPPMFAHFVTNFPAFHRILVFVSIQSFVVPRVPSGERFLIGRIGPPEYRLFRCIARYGYRDVHQDAHRFEDELIEKIAEFLQREGEGEGMSVVESPLTEMVSPDVCRKLVGSCRVSSESDRETAVMAGGRERREEVIELFEERESGVAYMMGQTQVRAVESSSFAKKLAINVVYGFLRRNCRRPAVSLGIPHTSLIEVGMLYYV